MPESARPLFVFLLIVDLILRGISLYKSARRDQKAWFIALLLVNSLGILPVIYLMMNKDVTFTSTAKAPSKKVAKKSRK